MLRIMIVDDEPVIRFGIKASVDWEKEGFVVAGDYANGEEALKHLQANPVHILITDIKMPVMDGLMLTRQAMKLDPRIKVIMVSSYNDFDFVRQGLKLGVVDYILKHMLEPAELLSVVQKCAEIITEEEQTENQLVDAHQYRYSRMRAKYIRELKRYLVHQDDVVSPGHYPDWLNSRFAAIYIRFNRLRSLEEMHGFLYSSIAIEQFIEDFYLKHPQSIIIPTEARELFILVPEFINLSPYLNELYDKWEQETNAHISVGYDIGDGIESITNGFLHSKSACSRDFLEGSGIYRYERDRAVKERHDLPSVLVKQQDLSSLTIESFEDLLAKWREDWVNLGASPAAFKEEACRILSHLYKDTGSSFDLAEAFEQLQLSETLDELCRSLSEQYTSFSRREYFIRKELSDPNNPVHKALEHMKAHYRETITLQQVADYVHVSKNYFSILFKKMTGQNFIDYVIDLRIADAKQLLAHSDLRIYEVAEKAGFNDVKYFSKLFKKTSGLSPIDYRQYHQLGRDQGSGGTPSL